MHILCQCYDIELIKIIPKIQDHRERASCYLHVFVCMHACATLHSSDAFCSHLCRTEKTSQTPESRVDGETHRLIPLFFRSERL